MKLIVPAVFAAILIGCASSPPPPPAHAETTSATLPREAFTPPGEWEMTFDDKDKDEPTESKASEVPATGGQADTTASKRKAGTLVTLPSNAPKK